MPTEKAQTTTEKYPKRGEVWLISNNPSVSNDPHLPRPVVIISTNPRNKSWESVLVVPLSTSLSNTHPKFHKLIQAGVGGVSRACHARCELVSNLEKFNLDSTTGPLGTLPDNYIWEIVRGIRASIGDNPDY
ncbi:MAG: type II toxin-antitoxin system PemK/MazF family toxin [Candidatus Obscuribacter sp.]|jgi:mRNA-degrading endonuclease toxin of MazEF toxin-antitoxin module|nr:type II toxin-antitoxin system PemK/MazF family toxin [Candidatus Obscuribacter sp.]MBK7840697.1 type II toxin-antitoxin system PemK/MazF family toxin [Candidatus Obscuribacter sp.]MBK9206727.1 type II toxin-antitoxin system PemK/MazF family toxin [Candidatus Obscuribacter sp.]MBK9620914.1 type II toxin-antitoxin system PemK/MazF family toxin [Candidatus Obscuribacter sp.]MBK9771370.1 type II toxin-antitoxin system PemK/MazF family toxin [Candidatus Obscuribacter sp.]